jgi:hypothetical protein
MAADFVPKLKHSLQRFHDVEPGQLEIEILESVAVADFAETQAIVNECRSFGVRFALDDFGTGYSSLASFRELEVDRLKIDQRFIRDMRHDKGDVQIVESVVRLAQAFERDAIAEGVETAEHITLLTLLGCRLGQGNGIARPMPADEFSEWARSWIEQLRWPIIDEARSDRDAAFVAVTHEHLCWFDRVAHVIENSDEFAARDIYPDQCSFGRWLRSSRKPHGELLGDFSGIAEAHDAIHATASELLERLASGKASEAKAQLPALRMVHDRFTTRLASVMR